MDASLWVAKTGLNAQQTRMSVIANNLANVNTTGFKRDRAVFEDLLYQNIKQAGGQTGKQTEGVQTNGHAKKQPRKRETERDSEREREREREGEETWRERERAHTANTSPPAVALFLSNNSSSTLVHRQKGARVCNQSV